MNIDQARKLKFGQLVKCPADRGSPAFTGTVRSEDCATAQSNENLSGEVYIWVTVSHRGIKSVWPSNRLG